MTAVTDCCEESVRRKFFSQQCVTRVMARER